MSLISTRIFPVTLPTRDVGLHRAAACEDVPQGCAYRLLQLQSPAHVELWDADGSTQLPIPRYITVYQYITVYPSISQYTPVYHSIPHYIIVYRVYCKLQYTVDSPSSSDVWMHLNQGLFRLNGGCGYILKPEVMRRHNTDGAYT